MKRSWRLLFFHLVLVVLTVLFSAPMVFAESNLSRSVVRLKIQAAGHNPVRPWQRDSSESRSGQAVAIGKYELVAVASQIRDHTLIQIQSSLQSELVEASVQVVDYDLDLCLLTVDPKAIAEPFVPVTFKYSLKIGDSIQFVWLTEDQRFLKTKGRLEHADTAFSPASQNGFLAFVASSDSFPGGYTEPVFQENKVIGLVQSLNSDKKTSILLPASLIQSFLKKTKTLPYQSSPKAGFAFSSLSDKITRAYLKLPAHEKRGVLIQDVYDFGSGAGELKTNDVLLKWGALDVDSKGAVLLENYGKVSLWTQLGEASVGAEIPCVIWRDGEQMALTVTLKSFSSEALPIPYQSPDLPPLYFIVGGYVFQELTLPYLNEFGVNWEARMNPALKKIVEAHRFHSIPGKQRVVLLTQALPHPINQGYQQLHQKIVESVNGVPVQELKDLPGLFSKLPAEGYFRIELGEHSPDVCLPAQNLTLADQQIKELYSLPRLSSFDEDKR